jgi:hypothetical protein
VSRRSRLCRKSDQLFKSWLSIRLWRGTGMSRRIDRSHIDSDAQDGVRTPCPQEDGAMGIGSRSNSKHGWCRFSRPPTNGKIRRTALLDRLVSFLEPLVPSTSHSPCHLPSLRLVTFNFTDTSSLLAVIKSRPCVLTARLYSNLSDQQCQTSALMNSLHPSFASRQKSDWPSTTASCPASGCTSTSAH